MMNEKIVWNGRDRYMLAADAKRDPDYDCDGSRLRHREQEWEAFDADEVDYGEIPEDEDGEKEYSGLTIIETLSGPRYFRISE
jgi:hypothetical protein